jgi:hypothetical protein
MSKTLKSIRYCENTISDIETKKTRIAPGLRISGSVIARRAEPKAAIQFLTRILDCFVALLFAMMSERGFP